MNSSKLTYIAIFITFLIPSTIVHAADQQRDKLQIHKDDPTYLQTQDRDQLRDHLKICCEDLMTPQEIEEYKNQYLALQTEQARNQFRQRHEEQMRHRAEQQGFTTSTTATQDAVSQSSGGNAGGSRGGNGSQGNGGNSSGGNSNGGGSGGGNSGGGSSGGGGNGGKGGGKGGGGKR